MTGSPYDTDLDPVAANHAPLTPLGLLERAAATYPDRTAMIHGDWSYTYREFLARCRRLASALTQWGIGVGDTVAVLAPNVPALLEAHFGVAMVGAVLNAINTRLDAATIAFILDHGEARLLIVDREYTPVVTAALARMSAPPPVVDIVDPLAPSGAPVGAIDYEAFLRAGDPAQGFAQPTDEWQAIALNYTSGTTGNPKGVVYHHRGAFLNAVGNVMVWAMPQAPVYLWTLPMFHCNGWCFPWTVTAQAGTHVCLRRVEAKAIYDAIVAHQVTHFCGAPIVLNMIINAAPDQRRAFHHAVQVMTAGAAPPSAVIAGMERAGFHVTHVYGLTEVYGPAVVCAWHDDWDALSEDQRSRLKARQGVRYPVLEGLTVRDPATMQPTPADGQTLGEVMFRGNIVMKGYLKNAQATAAAFAGGWFHSGDLAVLHADGYIEIKDRSKDIIISGGENISSIEVEDALYRHPAVLEAAVVARPDPTWGETPCAFVGLKPGSEQVTAEDIIAHCRATMASFKVPRTVVFGSLPKTSTGKIQKFLLREKAKAL
ncbi:MAG: acyl-CoA synthetase [Alphaproteobacteria bacterium]|nr:acyl-CoA synthetase [Alphaproteobacteria bacterium]